MQGAAAYPRTERIWRSNPEGARRTLEEACAIGRRHGLSVDDHTFMLGTPRHFPNGELARYGFQTSAEVIRQKDYFGADDRMIVRINPAILDSDDKILAVLIHELHEIEGLLDAFVKNGGCLTKSHLDSLIHPAKGRLHLEAWDRADEMVSSLIRGDLWP